MVSDEGRDVKLSWVEDSKLFLEFIGSNAILCEYFLFSFCRLTETSLFEKHEVVTLSERCRWESELFLINGCGKTRRGFCDACDFLEDREWEWILGRRVPELLGLDSWSDVSCCRFFGRIGMSIRRSETHRWTSQVFMKRRGECYGEICMVPNASSELNHFNGRVGIGDYSNDLLIRKSANFSISSSFRL